MLGWLHKDMNCKEIVKKETTFKDLYEKQVMFQDTIKQYYDFDIKDLPEDNVAGFSYHVQHLISEMGEVLDADKRWKNIRNQKYDREHKLEELADCFIVLMNVGIFSGFSANEIEKAISNKIDNNLRREI